MKVVSYQGDTLPVQVHFYYKCVRITVGA